MEQDQKLSLIQGRFSGQRGQAVVEYILLLVVIVTLVLSVGRAFGNLNTFMNRYIGEYMACLLEYGELPTLSVGNSDLKKHANGSGKVCAAKFDGFAFQASPTSSGPGYTWGSGTYTGGGGGYSMGGGGYTGGGGGYTPGGGGYTGGGGGGGYTMGGGGGNGGYSMGGNGSGSGYGRGSSSAFGSGGGSGYGSGSGSGGDEDGDGDGDGSGGSGRRKGRGGSGKSAYANGRIIRSGDGFRTADGEDSSGGKRKVIDSADKKRKSGGIMMSDYRAITGRVENEKYHAITGGEAEQIVEREVRTERAVSSVIKKVDEGMRVGPFKKPPAQPPKKETVKKDTDVGGFGFGNIIKWLMIAGMILAIVVFFGGQVMNYNNSSE